MNLTGIKQILANPANYGGKRDKAAIKYLVFHYTGNDGDTASANCRYYRDNIVKSSAHYYVDDNEVICNVPPEYIAWAVGGKKYANTKGASMYGIITNTNSISIEMCDCVRNGKYDFTEATLARAVELGKAVMEEYDIPIERVYCHYDVTGKLCPGINEWIYGARPAWEKFKRRLEDMTGEEIYNKLNDYLEEKPLPDWAKAEFEEAKALGITDGTRPECLIPRYQAAIMTLRAVKAAKK